MKRLLSLLAAALLIVSAVPAKADTLPDAVVTDIWYRDERAHLTVGSPTPMEGKFFTDLWGGSASDLDARKLLHAASPVRWDTELNRFRFDKSVAEDAVVFTDQEGNKVYLLALNSGLRWSDGTYITAKDYAFSILLQMDPAVRETGGTPKEFSWILGSDEYLSKESKTLSGVKIIGDDMLQITARKEAFPYFYELERLNIQPCPADVIAPGTEILDDGEGVYLSGPLTGETLKATVTDEDTGYLYHPSKVSGPYLLESFNGTTAVFARNPYYKGTEEGMLPRIGRITYTLAENRDMVSRLQSREIDLLDRVTAYESIKAGIGAVEKAPESFSLESEPRSGLTMIWFMDSSEKVQSKAVREAVACCFDREAFTRAYTGPFGTPADGFYGEGQWMYSKAKETGGLKNLKTYRQDIKRAKSLLEKEGITNLSLTMAVVLNEDPTGTLQDTLIRPLREAGISLTIVPVNMDTMQAAYTGRIRKYDMLYLGENFSEVFDPEILAPKAESRGDSQGLLKTRQELYALAKDMVRTDPEDITSFVRKWAALQEQITETLPLIPVYTNTYFEFFSRGLHSFTVTKAVTWSEAIPESYMSDIEELTTEENRKIKNSLRDLKKQMK